MNVVRGQVSENLRRVLDAPPAGATQSSPAASAEPPPRHLPLIPAAANSALPLQTGNLDVNASDHKVKFGVKEFVRFDEDEFPDSASCNNVTKAACGATSCRTGLVEICCFESFDR